MTHPPAHPHGGKTPHDKDYLRRLLAERNQAPANAAGIDAAIEQAFVRNVAILVLDMCGFSRITQRHGIIHFLAMIHQMEQAARPAIRGNGGEVIKQEADNLFAVFTTPEQALEAALDTLRALQAMNTVLPPERILNVSAGIGFGPTLVIAHQDLFGPEMNCACKLGEDIAGANDILLTQAAYAGLPPDRYVCAGTDHQISGMDLHAHRFEHCLFDRPLSPLAALNSTPPGTMSPE
ncbi:MAG: adenylate/guanylate cyclase domain-containing protein [Acidovorax sp.]|nr:adenylate/guanylate cyclase domain-containing protein [Acidovorax sp.]